MSIGQGQAAKKKPLPNDDDDFQPEHPPRAKRQKSATRIELLPPLRLIQLPLIDYDDPLIVSAERGAEAVQNLLSGRLVCPASCPRNKHMGCICNTYATNGMHMQHICSTYAAHIHPICNTYASHMQLVFLLGSHYLLFSNCTSVLGGCSTVLIVKLLNRAHIHKWYTVLLEAEAGQAIQKRAVTFKGEFILPLAPANTSISHPVDRKL